MIEHVQGMKGEKLNQIAQIWLDANLDAHSFINPTYWTNYYDGVKRELAKAELFIDTEDGQIQGFLGIEGNYIAGLFVAKQYRGQGIGSHLLSAAKQTRSELTLAVYEKNSRAYHFYIKEGFQEENHELDQVTDEFAVNMKWTKDGGVKDGRQ